MKPLPIIILMLCTTQFLWSQPQPGDVFREYRWYNASGDAGCSVRVGGREGRTNWNTSISDGHWKTAEIPVVHTLELEHAVKAEINVEKVLCHDATRGLAISMNDHDWLIFPEAENIPYPQWQYQHHIYPTVSVPLQHLKDGSDNFFRLKVDTTHTWNWPQNLIYGVHIRVYYEPDKVTHPVGKILTPKPGSKLGRSVDLEIEAVCTDKRIKEIDYVGLYEDVNWEGDGVYRQWHYHFYHGELIHHIGTTKTKPYALRWDTSWLPDQTEPMQIAARIVDDTNLIYMTEAVTELELQRDDFSVELCKPYDIPEKWVTRKGEMEQKFNVSGQLPKATEAQLVWSSWSPGYMNGVYINDKRVFDSEGPRYNYYDHRVPVEDMSVFTAGVNRLKTGETPLHDGHMVHGMEVNWPGIMVLIKYKNR